MIAQQIEAKNLSCFVHLPQDSVKFFGIKDSISIEVENVKTETQLLEPSAFANGS